MLEKKILFELPFVYTANEFELGNQVFFAAGSEREHPAYLIDPETNDVIKVADGPGGMMSIIPVPGRTDCLVSVMGLFPPFIGSEAGVFLHVRNGGTWGTEKVISLPFAHRCEILTINGESHLFTATCSSYKENPADWSKPGELYHTRIDNIGNGNWPTELIIDNLYRNHGMNKRIVNHAEVLCISGDEGIFGVQPGSENRWEVTQCFDRPVSEFVFFDLDGDGDDELITIEPFHGNSLNIYKNSGGWALQHTSPLSFGHGLSAGRFQNQSVVVVGNRRESGDLELHTVHSLSNIEKSVIESDVGATQTKLVSHNDIDHILSSNQTRNEVALYY